MMMKYCEDHAIMDMAYLDPTMITEALVTKKPVEIENYIVNFFLEHQNKRYICLPVTPRVTKILFKWLKMQLSLKAREDQAVEVLNQNLNYQDFKFEVPKCYLVWTDILSQQMFRIYWSLIRPCSQKRICYPWLVLRVCKSSKIMEVSKYLFQWSKQSKSTPF
jgi:hypothetical protein